jgi:hypothetical protein
MCNRCESCIDLAAGAGFEDLDLQPEHPCGFLQGLECGLGKRSISRIDHHGDASGSGHEIVQQPSRFATTSATKKLTPVALPPGRDRLATRPS